MDPRPTPIRTTAAPKPPRTTPSAVRSTTPAANRPGRTSTTSSSSSDSPSPTVSPTSTPDAASKGGLSTGAIAGIAAGAAVVLLVIVGCLVTALRRRSAYKKRKETEGSHDPNRDPINPFDVYPLENKNKYDQRSNEDSHDTFISTPLALGSDFSPLESQRNRKAEEAAREAQSKMFDQIYQEQIQSIYGADVSMAPRTTRSSRMPRHMPPARSNIVSPEAKGSVSTPPVQAPIPAALPGTGDSHHRSMLSSRAQPMSAGGGSNGQAIEPTSPTSAAFSSKQSSTLLSNSAHTSTASHQLPPPSSFSKNLSALGVQKTGSRPTPAPLPLATSEGEEVIEDNGNHFVLHSPKKFDPNSDRRGLVNEESDDDTKHNSSTAPSELSYRHRDASSPSGSRDYQYQKQYPPPLQQQQQRQQHQQHHQRQQSLQASSPTSHQHPVYSSHPNPYQPFPYPNSHAPPSSSASFSEPEAYAADRAYAAAGFPSTTTVRPQQQQQQGPRSPTSPTSPGNGRTMMSPTLNHNSPAMPPQSHTSSRAQPQPNSYPSPRSQPQQNPYPSPRSQPQQLPYPSHYDGLYSDGVFSDDGSYGAGPGRPSPGFGPQGGRPNGGPGGPPNGGPYSSSSPPLSPNQRRPGPGSPPGPGPSPNLYPSSGGAGGYNSGSGYNNGPGGYNNAGYNNGPGYQPGSPRGPPGY